MRLSKCTCPYSAAAAQCTVQLQHCRTNQQERNEISVISATNFSTIKDNWMKRNEMKWNVMQTKEKKRNENPREKKNKHERKKRPANKRAVKKWVSVCANSGYNENFKMGLFLCIDKDDKIARAKRKRTPMFIRANGVRDAAGYCSLRRYRCRCCRCYSCLQVNFSNNRT